MRRRSGRCGCIKGKGSFVRVKGGGRVRLGREERVKLEREGRVGLKERRRMGVEGGGGGVKCTAQFGNAFERCSRVLLSVSVPVYGIYLRNKTFITCDSTC